MGAGAGMQDCVCGFGLEDSSLSVSVLMGHGLLPYPQAVSGSRSSICGSLCWDNPHKLIGVDLLYGIQNYDIFFLFSFSICTLMLSAFITYILFVFFLHPSLSPSPEMCVCLLYLLLM